MSKIQCVYCDSTVSHYPWGKDGEKVCFDCGAEWPEDTDTMTRLNLCIADNCVVTVSRKTAIYCDDCNSAAFQAILNGYDYLWELDYTELVVSNRYCAGDVYAGIPCNMCGRCVRV